MPTDLQFMRQALALARRGFGRTSPNPMVGAVLVKHGRVLGRGWHRRAGGPHAEIAALADARRRGGRPRGATLYVTLEPCSTHGRTPPCTGALIAAGIRRVVAGAADPNPSHAGRGFQLLRQAGLAVECWGADPRPPETRPPETRPPARQRLADACARLNETFNHWIVHRTPFVTVKAAMTLDGKIATAAGESRWITGPAARAQGMMLRQGHDAILVGVRTVLADNPSLTVRRPAARTTGGPLPPRRRIILDSLARTPCGAAVMTDAQAAGTIIVVSRRAPRRRVAALARRARVLVAPSTRSGLNLRWLLKQLGAEQVTSVLVEGGGEVNASFLLGGLAHRAAFFYAPKILGGRDSRKAVAGPGARGWREIVPLRDPVWRRLGPDLFLSARVADSPLDGPRRPG